MKILIIGAKGMLGHDLVAEFEKDHEVIGEDIDKIDITREDEVNKKIVQLKPDIVINAAAFTDVDGCESNKEICMKVNGQGVGYLAKACSKLGIILVHYSTDYVFDGKKKEGYKEGDKPNPINIYAQSKALGEKELAKFTDKYYLIRSSWLYGKQGKNFVETMLNLAKEGDKIEVVNDQFGKPTYTRDLAKRTREIAEEKKDFGIYHVTNEGTTSWYEFTKKIFKLAGIDIEVKPVATEHFPRPAKRPKYSALINTKLPKMRSWEDALKDYLTI